MSGLNREEEIFVLDDGGGLDDEVDKEVKESFISESDFEVVESGVRECDAEGEAAERGESNIVTEFIRQVSFIGSRAEVDDEDFKKGDGVITVSVLRLYLSLMWLCVKEMSIGEEDFKRGVIFDTGFNEGVDKGKLSICCLIMNLLLFHFMKKI